MSAQKFNYTGYDMAMDVLSDKEQSAVYAQAKAKGGSQRAKQRRYEKMLVQAAEKKTGKNCKPIQG